MRSKESREDCSSLAGAFSILLFCRVSLDIERRNLVMEIFYTLLSRLMFLVHQSMVITSDGGNDYVYSTNF